MRFGSTLSYLSPKTDVYQRLHALRSYYFFLLRNEDASLPPHVSDVLARHPEALVAVALREQQREEALDELLASCPWTIRGGSVTAAHLESELRYRIACARNAGEVPALPEC